MTFSCFKTANFTTSRVKSSSIYLFGLKKTILFIIEIVLDFKTRKSQLLPLSWNSIQLSTWADKCHSWVNNSYPVCFLALSFFTSTPIANSIANSCAIFDSAFVTPCFSSSLFFVDFLGSAPKTFKVFEISVLAWLCCFHDDFAC